MRPSALQAVAGGLAATVAITAVMYWVAPLLLGVPMDIAKTLGDFLGIGWTGGVTFGMAAFASLIGHFIYGGTQGISAGPEHGVMAA